MNQPQKSRVRIEVFRAMILKHKGEDERSQYKVTPYKVLQYGVVPQVYQSEYDQLTQAIIDSKKVIDDSPLPLQEQFSYSTFFAENPDKICGEAVVSTSGSFAIKVKGNRQTVEDAIKKTLEKKNHVLSIVQQLHSPSRNVVGVAFKDSFYPNLRVGLSFKLNEFKEIPYGSDGYLEWFKCQIVGKIGNGKNVDITDKNQIRQYLDNPEIIKILKPYYPKMKANTDRSSTFVYRMKFRPFDIGCQPNGWIKHTDLNKKETGFYSELTYDRELTKDEVYKFELTPVNDSTNDSLDNSEISLARFSKVGDKRLVYFKEKRGEKAITVYMNIEFDGEKIRLGSDGYPQWDIVNWNSNESIFYTEITDKERIRKYFDNPLVKGLLQPYYPKIENEADRSRRLRLLKLRTQSFSFSQTI